MNKRNQKLYLPVKNKTNESTNWKTKLKEVISLQLKINKLIFLKINKITTGLKKKK